MSRDIERYAKEYLNADFEQRMVGIRRKKVLEAAGQTPRASVLEIGCGMDSIGNGLKGFERLTIVEPGSLFYQKALEDSRRWHGAAVRLVNGFFEQQAEALSNEAYDLIIISSLLHEVPAPEAFMRQVRRLCSPNTVVHVNVPNAMSLHRLLALESRLIPSLESMSQRNVALQQNRVFTLDSLKETLAAAGRLRVLDQGSFFIKPFSHAQMERCLKQGIFGEDVLLGFERVIRYLPDYGAEIFINFQYP